MLSSHYMKKLLAFIWLLIYTCVSTGFAVSTHFCMDKQQAVELGAAKTERCNKCGMHKEESNGCCRDEIQVVKLQQDTQVAKLFTPSLQLALPVSLTTTFLNTPFYNFIESSIVTAFQPPPLYNPDLCIDNCVFRI